MKTEKFEKLKTLSKGAPSVVFRWIHVGNKLENKYVSLTNLRLELLLLGYGQCKLVRAAPIMTLVDRKPAVIFKSDNILLISQGIRKGIIVAGGKLKEGEEGHIPKLTGVIDLDTAEVDDLEDMYDLATSDAFPGTDMLVPALYRCTTNPEKLKLAFNTELKEALNVTGTSVEQFQKAFIDNIDAIAAKTTEGWVIPFKFVHAGGMIIVDGTRISKTGKTYTQKRTYALYKTFRNIYQWELPLLEESEK